MASDSPVDEVDNMADADEADGRQKEVMKVEAIVRLVGGLNHSLIKVVKYHRDV